MCTVNRESQFQLKSCRLLIARDRASCADVLSEAGHTWVGLDISSAMLDIAVARGVDGDTLLADMGQGFGFRAGMFDGVVR